MTWWKERRGQGSMGAMAIYRQSSEGVHYRPKPRKLELEKGCGADSG
jgi:hypothetical protein